MQHFDIIIIGAGAAGLMCAIEAGKRGRKVLLLDHADKPGKKILISGGGRCNFTNLNVDPDCYISQNPHFCKSALSRYTQWDFIELVKKHGIPYHEKTLGQLFCDGSAREIVAMLVAECEGADVEIQLNTSVAAVAAMDHKRHSRENGNPGSVTPSTLDSRVRGNDGSFRLETNQDPYTCQSLVIATGGLSIPVMGATPFGYKIAEQFGIKLWPTRAGLVPFTLQPEDKEHLEELSGIAVPSIVSTVRQSFKEALLFTHRGLSGPAILQSSSYWEPGEDIVVKMLPELDIAELLFTAQQRQPKSSLRRVLAPHLAKRISSVWFGDEDSERPLNTFSKKELAHFAAQLQAWRIQPGGTEGYRTAEVTIGGVDCNELSSQTMESRRVPGLYFIGEVVDVTGWLGGYNFQWAWSSGWSAGQNV